MTKHHNIIHRAITFSIGAALIFAFLVRLWIVIDSCFVHADVNSWGYTEFLINWQGGFVRRGLVGECLFGLTHMGMSGKSIIHIIQVVCLVCYAWVLVWFVRQFHTRKWNWWLLMSPLFMGLVNDLLRKDFLMISLLIAILYILGQSTTCLRGARLWIGTAVCLVGLFIHEAFMFWGVPIIVVLLLTSAAPKWQRVCSVGLIALSFIILCFFKGDLALARRITASWLTLFPDMKSTDMNSIGAIGWDTAWTAHFHFTKNFCVKYVGWIGLVLQPVFFMYCSYLICNCVYAFSSVGEERVKTRDRLVAVYVMTAVCMIPMFTFLSVDIWRLYQYLAVASFAAVIIIPATRIDVMFPAWYRLLVSRLNKAVDIYLTPSKGLMVIMIFMSDINGIYERYTYDVNYIAVSTLSSIWHGLRLLGGLVVH